jgi:hypothetical protein
MNAKKFKYPCIIYKQNKQSLITFNVDSKDVLKWSGVPTKADIFHGGFQRALGKRYEEITNFFESAKGISPTSVVVAFREGFAKVSELPYPESNWPEKSSFSSVPQYGILEFEFKDYENSDLTELRIDACKIIKNRLGLEPELEEDDEPTSNEDDQDEQSDDDISENDALDEKSPSNDLDIGTSSLTKFYNFLSSDTEVQKWLVAQNSKYEQIENKKNKSKKDKEFLIGKPETRLINLLKSLLRPAVIVDGQHRVTGANEASCDPIHFTICALHEANWVEQVFQFVVINKKGRPISSDFLTSIVNTSLQNEEIKVIKPRLEKVGIELTDANLMKFINFDPSSPFHQMIEQPGITANNIDKLSSKGMIKLAKRWFNLTSGKNQSQWKELFSAGIKGKNLGIKIQKWRKEEGGGTPLWFEYFSHFWKAIKDRYESEGNWKSKNYLMYIVTMNVIQNYYLNAQHEAGNSFKSPSELYKKVSEWIKPCPASFFADWKKTGLQSGDGPNLIEEAFKAARKGADFSKKELFKD